tara:strand:- start:3537 stop:4139 length:603 start_codon:yes stop_codon:yes gene_type:complete
MPRPRNPELPTLLLAAAEELLVKKGGPHFSLRELSARVGYTLTAVYRCFENRAALLRQLNLRLFSEFNSYCVPPLDSGPLEATRMAGRRFVQWAVEHPTQYLFMFSEYGSDSLLTSPEEKATARIGLVGITTLLRMSKQIGQIDIEDPEATAIELLCYLHGLASLALSGRLEGTPGNDALEFLEANSTRMINRLLSIAPQ